MPYNYDERPNTIISSDSQNILDDIKSSDFSILAGKNNCGKSYILKLITEQLGQRASYLGPARYQNFNVLGYYTPNRNRKEEKWRQFIQQWQREQQNFDNSPLNLQQAIAELNDDQRGKLFEIVEKLLGTKLEILHTVSDNTMSQKYITCGDHNISYTSSGFRLIMTLVTSLLDNDYDTFLIDEPELGISPEAQGVFAQFIYNQEYRGLYFPHIKHLIIATHSTIFLDRQNIRNNYSITKNGDIINIAPTQNISEFNRINFFLLGNRFETLYLPSMIVFTEGKTDYEYINHVLRTKYPDYQFSVIPVNSDGRIKDVVYLTSQILNNIQKSPYRDRIVIILDKVRGAGIVESLTKLGIPENNIVVWTENGIEYYYPHKIIDEIYGAGGNLTISEDVVSKNGLELKKWELCQEVIKKIGARTEFPKEIREKLFALVDKILE